MPFVCFRLQCNSAAQWAEAVIAVIASDAIVRDEIRAIPPYLKVSNPEDGEYQQQTLSSISLYFPLSSTSSAAFFSVNQLNR